MNYQVISLNVGKPRAYTWNNKELFTGFVKQPVHEKVWLSKLGFTGDGQADRKNHGGEDKALLMYAKDHYNFWQTQYSQEFNMPSFGENITIDGLLEEDVSVGDVFTLGEAEIQVSQPRQPCYKIAEVHQIKDIPAVVTETGFTGYYFRVLKEGYVSPNDQLTLMKKDENKVSIAYIHQSLFHERQDENRIRKILEVDALAASLRASLTKRLIKLT
ncbi:MOSC domain-containing protein [Aquibacillus koreensis]|uniref:MOSC domain-containing protein n=1 Tax=Aquibacillus koreensis TaxID=279446 RepID=A0A9X3WKG1_9BACI|nr:MOSC domain-containing protein [Aquibacillus koreensis]MCT2534445.1 MOSC domain-containing protein [Aquibacillus koreensis]MDC3421752.1 MOSC domain-containing protein [Aquibacillus koreensis]